MSQLLVSIGIATLKYIPGFSLKNEHSFALLVMMFLILSLLVLLLFCNRYMTKEAAGKGLTLSIRYQLAENIKALKVIIPIITCDSMITVFDLGTQYFFKVSRTFDMSECDNSTYIREFISCQVIRLALQIAIPLWVLYSHPPLKKFITRKRNITKVVEKGRRSIIKNVLGKNIGDVKQNETYETILKRLWL
ncbi:hypothetical protein ANCCAN_02902 [Ancylostoma caninum]|uniref:Uncharacterized protein n=1 Tax=Ancylostoma caninum TaxID=29170 RepID=A0A368H5H7_ANCCA|nr:hypothetical protein ANCCAN_02902 [Ancylostoma caninum]